MRNKTTRYPRTRFQGSITALQPFVGTLLASVWNSTASPSSFPCFVLQAHIVHYNRHLYKSFDKAAKNENGLTVLGIFIEVGLVLASFQQGPISSIKFLLPQFVPSPTIFSCTVGSIRVSFQEGNDHAAFKQITDLIPKATYADESVDLERGFDPSCLLPGEAIISCIWGRFTTTNPSKPRPTQSANHQSDQCFCFNNFLL